MCMLELSSYAILSKFEWRIGGAMLLGSIEMTTFSIPVHMHSCKIYK